MMNQDGRVDVINQKFFERGHSQMESDSVHSSIETAKRRTSVYVPSQWHTVVSLARRKKPCVVIPLKYADICDFKSLSISLCPNMKYSTTGAKVNLKSNGSRFADQYQQVFLNVTFNSSEFEEVKVPSATRAMTRQQKWQETCAKKADLHLLCTSGIIPEEYHAYYNGLTTVVISD